MLTDCCVLLILKEAPVKRKNTANKRTIPTIIDTILLNLNSFHDSLFIISTNTRTVKGMNMLPKIVNVCKSDPADVILDMMAEE
jgi:hypothetical protein